MILTVLIVEINLSVELKGVDSIGNRVLLTKYWGGVDNGICLQLTPRWGGYTQLTKTQALQLALSLIKFAKDIDDIGD